MLKVLTGRLQYVGIWVTMLFPLLVITLWLCLHPHAVEARTPRIYAAVGVGILAVHMHWLFVFVYAVEKITAYFALRESSGRSGAAYYASPSWADYWERTKSYAFFLAFPFIFIGLPIAGGLWGVEKEYAFLLFLLGPMLASSVAFARLRKAFRNVQDGRGLRSEKPEVDGQETP